MRKLKTILRLNCNKEKETPISEIKRGRGKFCSVSCSASYNKKKKKPNLTCAYCKVEFYRHPSKMRSKSGLFFCCREHKDISQKIGGFKEIMPSHYGSEKEYRKFALRKYGATCNRCGYNKNIAAIVVHHKDHNRKNNNVDNLEVLCANCHAIEHWSND